jgi:hypothetical protein
MRARCRPLDWASTALGPVEGWSTSLRTTAGTVLSSRQPMFLWWGRELIQLFNDGYHARLGAPGQHPHALGTPAREFWSDAWDAIGPGIERVMAGDESMRHGSQHRRSERSNRCGDTGWTCSYSPVRDDDGSIGGTLGVCAETTRRGRAERRTSIVNHELAGERERVAYIFRHAPASLAVLCGPEHVIELANEAFAALIGHRELVGRPVFDAIPEIRERFRPFVDDDVANGERVIGREVPALLQTSPDAAREEHFFDFAYVPFIEPDGTRSGVIVHGMDVTLHVRARRTLEALVQLEREARAAAEANAQAHEEVLGIVAHDLGNPVAAIDMAATALLRCHPPTRSKPPPRCSWLRHERAA